MKMEYLINKTLSLKGAFKSFSNVKDIGIVQVKVMRAEGLMAADVTGNHTSLIDLYSLRWLWASSV